MQQSIFYQCLEYATVPFALMVVYSLLKNATIRIKISRPVFNETGMEWIWVATSGYLSYFLFLAGHPHDHFSGPVDDIARTTCLATALWGIGLIPVLNNYVGITAIGKERFKLITHIIAFILTIFLLVIICYYNSSLAFIRPDYLFFIMAAACIQAIYKLSK